jgi:hypothetical protein
MRRGDGPTLAANTRDAVGEAGVVHDFLDGHAGIALAVEEPPGAFEDFLARVALVLR